MVHPPVSQIITSLIDFVSQGHLWMRIFSSQTYIWKFIHTEVLYLMNSLLGLCCEEKRNNGHLSLWLCVVITRSIIRNKGLLQGSQWPWAWLTQFTWEPTTDMACKKGQAIQEMTKPGRLPENEIGEWEVTAKLLCFPYQFSIQMRKESNIQLQPWQNWVMSFSSNVRDQTELKSNLFHYAGNKWLNN